MFSTDLAPGVSPCVSPAGGIVGVVGVLVLKPVHTHLPPAHIRRRCDVGQCKEKTRVAEIPIPQYPLRPFIDEENLENPELRGQSRCSIPKWRPQSEKKSTDPLGRKSYLWCSDMISSWRYSTSLFMWSSSMDGESWNPLLPPPSFSSLLTLASPLFSLLFSPFSLTSLPPLLFLSPPLLHPRVISRACHGASRRSAQCEPRRLSHTESVVHW